MTVSVAEYISVSPALKLKLTLELAPAESDSSITEFVAASGSIDSLLEEFSSPVT